MKNHNNEDEMGVLSENERQLNFYYYPGHKLADDALAYAISSDAKVKEIDISKNNLTGTQWVELAEMLDVKVADLLEKEHPVFQDKFDKTTDVGTEDAIKLLQHNPELLIYPIATRGKKAICVRMMTDVLKLTKPDSGNAPNE